jgi:hypothetical protein
MKLAPFALVALLLGVTSASATVYSVDGVVGTGGVTGFIQTDGTTGTLSDVNIQDWNLVISTDATHSFDLLGPLSGNNSQEGIFGSGLSATATGLFFDFSLPPSTYVLFQNPVLGSGTNFICLNGCSTSVNIGVGDFRATSDLEGEVQIGVATTPLPAALPLFGTGLGALALFASGRKRKKKSIAAV